MNDYEISKLKKELQRKQQLLKEEQQNLDYTEKQLVKAEAERDKYHNELLIARRQIENIDKIIAENVKSMKAKLQEENSQALTELRNLKDKLITERTLNEKKEEQIRNKDAVIGQLSAKLKEMSKKYKDPSISVNTKQISQQVTVTHNQFYKLTEKYDKICKDMENIMAENKILRKLHGVPDNFGFDLEEIKIAEKQQLEDYKAQCRKLQTQIEQLQAERTQLRYRLRQYNTLFSNKGERYKDMTQQQLQLLDQYALNLKEGKIQLPQIDKSVKETERQLLKLRAQVQVLQNKYPNIIQNGPGGANNNQISSDQMRRFQQQIQAYLQPLAKDMKKISQSNISSLIQNLQNIQGGQFSNNAQEIPTSNFKGPIPLPIAHNNWSKIKEGYSFMYSSKIPVDMKDLQGDVSFDVVKAKYQVAALQLQNIQSLKLLKQKQKIQNLLSKELLDLKQKYKKCLKVQDELFIRYFTGKQADNDKMKRLEIEKHNLSNQNAQLDAQVGILRTALDELSSKGGSAQKKLNQYTSRLAISEAEVLKLQRKYQIISDQQKMLRQTYTKLELKAIDQQKLLKQRLIRAKNNERELSVLVNRVLEQVKGSVSADVHNNLLEKMELIKVKNSGLINKETELRLRIQKLESLERDSTTKDEIIENLREDNLQILLELEIVRNRLKTVDYNYLTFCQTFDRLVAFVNQKNISLMAYFKKSDQDGSGQLDKAEFRNSLDALGFKLNENQLGLLFSQFDLDGSGAVTYKEFLRKMRRGGAISRTQQEEAVLKLFRAIQHCKLSIRQAFQIIDVDQSNQISKSQMTSALKKIGISTTQKTVEYLFRMCDNDNDGQISCSQLQKLYKQMVSQSDIVEKQIYSTSIDWKFAFLLKLEEVSDRFKVSLAQTFKKMDDDGNQVWTIVELSQFVKKSGLQVQTSALKELFDFLDRRRDGKVEYGQFLKVLAEAKSESKRIQRLKYIRQRTTQLKNQSYKLINSKQHIQSQSIIHRDSEVEKLKIKIESLQTKHKNLLKRSEKLAHDLAYKEQQVKQLNKTVLQEQKQSEVNLSKYHEQKVSKINLQSLTEKGMPAEQAAKLKKKINQLQIKSIEMINNLELYKGLYEGLTEKNKGQELRIGKIQAERNKYYDVVKQLQSTSDLKAEVGKLHIQCEYSKRNQEIINSKYDKIVQDLRKIDDENRKLTDLSVQKQKQIINSYLFFEQKGKLQQTKIDELSLKIVPTVSFQKMQQFMIKLRQISNSKSSLQEENRMIREKNFNLQARNDYVQNQKVHIEELQRKLRNMHPDQASKAVIDLTKKLSDYKMNELKAKRQMNLLRQKQEYYMRVNNTHLQNIKEIELELSNWEIKFNQREQFWRKRLSDQMKLMQGFQQQANKAKQEQLKAVNYFSNKNIQQQSVNKKYRNLSAENHNNISQYIRNPSDTNDQYTQKLLQKVAKLEQDLMDKQRQLHQLKTAWKQIVPEANHRLSDFGSQMNISTNSFVLQTQLTGSQLKSNARRFINNQKEAQTFYKEQNARITKIAEQSIQTLQKIIDDKNQQIRKKERIIQDLKKQFHEASQRDCRQIQKLNEQIRQLRSKTQMGSINELMTRTTNRNFYPGSKSENKVQQLLKAISDKQAQVRQIQNKYDQLLISKTSANNQKTASKNAHNSEKLKLKLEQLYQEREHQKTEFFKKEKQLQQQISNLKKLLTTKTKKIEQLNNALKDIKDDIVNEKSNLTGEEAESNLKTFVQSMTKGSNKNDAAMQQYMQSAIVKIKNLENQNRDLKDELSKAKQVMGKTANRFNKR